MGIQSEVVAANGSVPEDRTMRVFSRIGMIAALSAGVVGSDGAASARQPPDTLHALSAPSGGTAFHLNDAAGHYLALHFLTRTDTPECTAFTRDYLQKAPTVAGVRHIFVKADDAAAVNAWAAQFGDDAKTVYVDPAGALAKDLSIPSGLAIGGTMSNYPATVVFGPDGKELFRHVGLAHDGHLAFAEFAKNLAEKSKALALADYNLPPGKPLAVEGYDLVAYFTQNKAAKGRPELPSTYRGATYQFATDANRRLFAADPEKYLPTYGGWCASAMGAKGTKVEIDPTNFKVKDGRLFLFYKNLLADALKDWNKHEQEWEPAADRNWKKLTAEEPIKPSK
jgi:YHS domain-containing protein/peroxiredoxin